MLKTFNKSQQIKVNSPEQLNDYIKTSNPSVWLVIAGILILLCSVLVWATFGYLNTTVSLKGVVEDNRVLCFSSENHGIKSGDSVTVNGLQGLVTSISKKPISKDEVIKTLNADEYTLYCLNLHEWNYVVEIEIQNSLSEEIVEATIVTESTSPISLILNYGAI